MAMSMELIGQKIDASIVMNIAATKVGDAVKVSFPSDLDSYKTVEEQITEELDEQEDAESEKQEDAEAEEKAESEKKDEDAASDKAEETTKTNA